LYAKSQDEPCARHDIGVVGDGAFVLDALALASLLPFAEGPFVVFVVFVALASVTNVPGSVPSIDTDPSSKSGGSDISATILGNNDIIERLWALVTTAPRIDVRRRMNCMVVGSGMIFYSNRSGIGTIQY
jgi:hypothetical protein